MKINEIINEGVDYSSMGSSNYKSVADKKQEVNTSRRDFLRKGAALAGAAAVGAVGMGALKGKSIINRQRGVKFSPLYSRERLRANGFFTHGHPNFHKALTVAESDDGVRYYISYVVGYVNRWSNGILESFVHTDTSSFPVKFYVENKENGKIRIGDGDFNLYPENSVVLAVADAIFSLAQ